MRAPHRQQRGGGEGGVSLQERRRGKEGRGGMRAGGAAPGRVATLREQM